MVAGLTADGWKMGAQKTVVPMMGAVPMTVGRWTAGQRTGVVPMAVPRKTFRKMAVQTRGDRWLVCRTQAARIEVGRTMVFRMVAARARADQTKVGRSGVAGMEIARIEMRP